MPKRLQETPVLAIVSIKYGISVDRLSISNPASSTGSASDGDVSNVASLFTPFNVLITTTSNPMGFQCLSHPTLSALCPNRFAIAYLRDV